MFFWKILCAPSVDIITNNGLSEKDEMASGGQAFITFNIQALVSRKQSLYL